MKELNPQVWFGNRELDFKPPHFIKTSTPVDKENYAWVVSKLSGRFCTADGTLLNDSNFAIFVTISYFYFEDPKDAMLFELRWAGK
jgi:hypothetical protein